MNLSSCLPLAALALTACLGRIDPGTGTEPEPAGAGPADLTDRQPEATKPAPDPNDVWLAFGAGDAVYVARADGSLMHRLELGMSASAPAFSPDGRSLAFSGPGGIWVYDFAEGEAHPIVDEGAGTPAWSPDGAQIAFTRGVDVYVADAKGSAEHAFVHGPPPGQAWYSNYGHPVFAEGGLSLIVGHRGGLDIGDPDGSERRPLFVTSESEIVMATVSPDGASLAVLSACGLRATPLVDAAKPCDGVLLDPTSQAVVPPAWSANEQIAFADGWYTIRVVPAAGGTATPLVDTRQSLGGVYVNELSWSPPGTAIP